MPSTPEGSSVNSAAGVAATAGDTAWTLNVHCSKGLRSIRSGMVWRDLLHGGEWEVVEPSGGRAYSPSGLGGTPVFWCKFVGDPKDHHYRDYARDDGCVEFCGDSIAAALLINPIE